MIPNFNFKLSRKRQCFGIAVGVLFGTKEEQLVAFAKVEEALGLIRTYDARRFAQIQRDVQRILVFGDATATARWYNDLRMVEFYREYIVSKETSAAEVASTLVHEASHARLMRLGFGYEEADRLQVERICFKSEQAFARRLPDGAALIERAARMMDFYGAEYFSDAGQIQVNAQALRANGVPKWIVQWLVRVGTRRRAQWVEQQQKGNGA